MKRKLFLVILVLILAIFLSGCGGIVLPAIDEAKIKSVMNEYCLTLNNQDWSKAKSLCVYGSTMYNELCYMEAIFINAYLYCNIITINVAIDIQNVSINGNFASVSAYTNGLITGCGDEYYDFGEGESTFTLQKVGNNWKIY